MSAMKPTEDPATAPREILPEEKTFDRAVYGGISYGAQAAAGIVLTYFLKYGSGKPLFEKVSKWLGPKLFRNKSVEEAAKEISTPLMVTAMIMVGNAFLLPVKWLENRKPQIIRAWHEKNVKKLEADGTPLSEEEKAHGQECLKQLEETPKQTWKSLLGGRGFGLAAVYATLFALGNKRNEAAENYSAKMILKGADAVGLKSLAKSDTFAKYIHVGFLDVFYSMVSAGGLYAYSHVLNPPKHRRDEGLIPDLIFGPTPATPAVNALETKDNKYEDYIDLDKQQTRQFTHAITPRKASPIQKTPKPLEKLAELPESYRNKLASEDISRELQTPSPT